MTAAMKDRGASADLNDGNVFSRDVFVERFGEASGTTLFEVIADDQRQGDAVVGMTVKAARGAFKADNNGRATLITPGRAGSKGVQFGPGVVVISLDDLETVVKAQQPAFSWADAFAPRADLPMAERRIEVQSGAQGQRDLHF